jgi:hypothetical protein
MRDKPKRSSLFFHSVRQDEDKSFTTLPPEIRDAVTSQQLPEVPHPSPPSVSIAKRGNVEEYLDKGVSSM